MGNKNPLAPLTIEHNLVPCSMGRCCNVKEIIRLKKEIFDQEQAIRNFMRHLRTFKIEIEFLNEQYGITSKCLEEVKK